uniref:Uncharacterized protein n=1 Tax=candidate division WOR-3 bacterium TaxID=2052148 RepID=A0A7C6A9H2_UNCW3
MFALLHSAHGQRDRKVLGREIITLFRSLRNGLIPSLTQAQPQPYALVLPLAKHLAYLLADLPG